MFVISDEAEVHLTHACAVAVFKTWHGGEFVVDAVMEIAFPYASEFKFADPGNVLNAREGAEAWGDLFVEHRIELPRRAGKEEYSARGAAINPWRKVETGGSTVRIR